MDVPPLLSPLWKLKLRLQFTGWLQFLPPAALGALAFFLAAAAAGLRLPIARPFAALGSLALLNFAFEVLTLRLGLRPREAIPAPATQLDAFTLMRSRRSCRSFQARDLTPEHRAALLESAARHTRADALLGERPIRLAYVAAPLTVWPVLGAREFLIAIAPAAYDRLAVIDVGRALQKVVLDATRAGLGTCWIGPGADQASVAAKLGSRFDPARDHLICVCAVGYPSRLLPLTIRVMQRMQHRRLPLRALFFEDPALETPLDTTQPPFDRFGRCYEVCQWSPSSYNEQPTRGVGVRGPEGAVARMDFYTATDSRYYAPVALGIWTANWEEGCAALGIPGRLALAEEARSPRYGVSWMANV